MLVTNAIAVLLASTALSANEPTDDHAAIETVRAQFDAAIRNQDLPALQALFLDRKVNWLSTGHPASRAFVAKQTGEPEKVVMAQGADKLIGRPEYRSLRLEERFGPMTVVSDGQLATATFNYDFRANGQIQNWGKESWQLARTEQGWKIVNLMFSFNFQPIAPEPEGWLAP